jgi:general stress protein 26
MDALPQYSKDKRMDHKLKARILEILDRHRVMTVATNRLDGWPQATTVGYVNIGLTLYFWCSPQSQKADNLTRDTRISLAIADDASDPMTIAGLSMAAEAELENSPPEISKALSLLYIKYPEHGPYRASELDEILLFRVTPKVISLIDYTKGFGHTDLIIVDAGG